MHAMNKLKIGDLVAIRGDLRVNIKGNCAYTPDQLVDGKFLKRHGTDEIWAGRVEKIVHEEAGDMVLVGGWRLARFRNV
jgi:hypothetical protein